MFSPSTRTTVRRSVLAMPVPSAIAAVRSVGRHEDGCMADETGRWVALLRGVNIGGVRIRMAELAEALTDSGFEAVRTVLASGNVVLTGAGDAASIADGVASVIGDRVGYSVAVIAVPIDAVRRAVERYPVPRAADRHASAAFG